MYWFDHEKIKRAYLADYLDEKATEKIKQHVERYVLDPAMIPHKYPKSIQDELVVEAKMMIQALKKTWYENWAPLIRLIQEEVADYLRNENVDFLMNKGSDHHPVYSIQIKTDQFQGIEFKWQSPRPSDWHFRVLAFEYQMPEWPKYFSDDIERMNRYWESVNRHLQIVQTDHQRFAQIAEHVQQISQTHLAQAGLSWNDRFACLI